jgi:hypothetical protein
MEHDYLPPEHGNLACLPHAVGMPCKPVLVSAKLPHLLFASEALMNFKIEQGMGKRIIDSASGYAKVKLSIFLRDQ